MNGNGQLQFGFMRPKGDMAYLKSLVDMNRDDIRSVVLWAERAGYLVRKDPHVAESILIKIPDGRIAAAMGAGAAVRFLQMELQRKLNHGPGQG